MARLPLFACVDGGEAMAIEVDCMATVADVHAELATHLGDLPFDMSFQGEALSDLGATLADLGICPESTIQVSTVVVPTWAKNHEDITLSKEDKRATRTKPDSRNCIAQTRPIPLGKKGFQCAMKFKNYAGLVGLKVADESMKMNDHMGNVERHQVCVLQTYDDYWATTTKMMDGGRTNCDIPKALQPKDKVFTLIISVERKETEQDGTSSKLDVKFEICPPEPDKRGLYEYSLIRDFEAFQLKEPFAVAIGLYNHEAWAEFVPIPPRA